MKIRADLSNLSEVIAARVEPSRRSAAQTIFLKRLSLMAHQFYGGKMQSVPKAGVWGFNWFNVWYTPGVSAVSTSIRDDHDSSFTLSNRSNLVAVVSDSTRVLGDGDCTPAGGLGVMEGKAMLMKYLGGVDAIALCVNNRNSEGKPDPRRLIDFVLMLEPSVGAVNLEDISQPNCYEVLDTLRKQCDIPVWHDDAQGTACVTLAGLINALRITGKSISAIRTVLYGAGASNTTIASFLIQSGMPAQNMIIFDSRGALHLDRNDIATNPEKFKQWELAQITNPDKIGGMGEAMQGADVLIALSTPGPDTIKPEWIRMMNERSIVFVCANPVPEIYPDKAKEAGACIVATGRGDFPNQINNSCGFPGILKGALMVRARKITDNMAIRAAHALADYAEHRGISRDNIVPKMDESDVFAITAREVAMQAIADGVARSQVSCDEAYQIAKKDIAESRAAFDLMMQSGMITHPPNEMIDQALEWTLSNLH